MFKYALRVIRYILVILITAISLPTSSFGATLTLGGTGAGLGTMKQLAVAFNKHFPATSIDVRPSVGSAGGIRAVTEGMLDIGVSSRALKDEEITPVIKVWAYAKSPFVLAVHQKLPVTHLTFQQVLEIYDGSLQQWEDGTTVRVILRSINETDTVILKQFIPGMEAALAKAYQRRGPPIATTDQDIADKIQSIPGAVGTSTLSLILGENRPLKALSLNNVAPTVENIANGTYPMSKTLYLITQTRAKAEVQQFIDFIQSKEGTAILKRTGHLVLNFKEK